MKKTKFSDASGKTTLDIISVADKFNEWMFKEINPYCKGEILEIGSGIGNISSFFLKENKNITLSELREEYCEILKKFENYPNLKGIIKMNLTDHNFDENFLTLFNSFDSIFALNVIEHIEDDKKAIENCFKLLKKGGNLIILVPSYNFLYNKFDKELGHFKRYNTKRLKEIFPNNSCKITYSSYFNFTGIIGWYINGKFSRKNALPQGQMNIFNKLVPLFKIIDIITLKKMGLSTIVIAQKTN